MRAYGGGLIENLVGFCFWKNGIFPKTILNQGKEAHLPGIFEKKLAFKRALEGRKK
jgi:hypothetical protein